MTVEKPKPKQLLRPITTGANSAMNQSQFLAITCNSLETWEKWRVHGAIGFGFASLWLKNWRESFRPITERSNRNDVITFDRDLKTALLKESRLTLCRGRLVLDKIFHLKHCPLTNVINILALVGYSVHRDNVVYIRLLFAVCSIDYVQGWSQLDVHNFNKKSWPVL